MEVRKNLNYHPMQINLPALSRISFFISVLFALCRLCYGEQGYDKIPALGRNAVLGQLYNGNRDEFIELSVFDRTKPLDSNLLTTTALPSTRVSYTGINEWSDRLKLLDIDFNSGLNILSMLTPVRGSAGFLKEEIGSSNEVTVALLIRHESSTEDLDLLSYDVKDLLDKNKAVLGHTQCTHIVTGITWGWTTVVKFTLTNPTVNTKNSSHKDQLQLLKSDLAKLKSQFSQSNVQNFIFTSNFTAVVLSDISPTNNNNNPMSPAELQRFLQTQLPLPLSSHAGKTFPLDFHLTSVWDIIDNLGISVERDRSNRPHSISNWILKDFLTIFDEQFKTQQKLNDLKETLNSNHNCLDPQISREWRNLSTDYLKYFDQYKKDFQSALIEGRSGKVDDLLELSSKYYDGEFSPNMFEQKPTHFTPALEKVKFCDSIKSSHANIQYFGKNDNLRESIENNTGKKNKPIYILFKKTEFTRNDPKAWEENLNLFLKTLYKPFNLLFIVDCDFDHSECQSVNGTVIKQMKYERFTIDDVLAEVRKGIDSKPIKLKAFGRSAVIGELYNAKTEQFLGLSILSTKYDPSLIRVTNLSSGNRKNFCKTEQVDEETKFSILAGLFPNTSTDLDLEGTFVLTNNLKSEEIVINTNKLEKSLNPELLNSNPKIQEATHFVAKIDYGNDLSFSIKDKSNSRSSSLNKHSPLQTIRRILPTWNHVDNFNLINTDSAFLEISNNRSLGLKIISQTYENTQLLKLSNVDTLEQLQEFLNLNCIQLFSVDKSVPVTYILFPISKLGSDAGLLIHTDTYQPLTSTGENPKIFSEYFDKIDRASFEIEQVISLQDNQDCITDEDTSTLQAFQQEFQSLVNKFREDFKQVSLKIRNGELVPGALRELRLAFEQEDYFSFDGRYRKLEQLLNIRKKINFCKYVKASSGITYVGRDSPEFEFKDIFLPTTEAVFEVYLLYFKPEWNDEYNLEWLRQSHYFFNYLTQLNGTEAGSRRFYVVNCEFAHPHCDNLTKPKIMHYQNGRLITFDSFSSVEVQQSELKNKTEELEKKIAEVVEKQEQLIQKQQSNEKAIANNTRDIGHVVEKDGFKEGSSYTFTCVANNLVLDLAYLKTDNGAQMWSHPANGGPNQKWRSSRAVGGWTLATLVPTNGVKILDQDVPSSVLQLWNSGGGLNQHWYTRSVLPKGVYMIISAANAKAITSKGLRQSPKCEEQDIKNTLQHWVITEV